MFDSFPTPGDHSISSQQGLRDICGVTVISVDFPHNNLLFLVSLNLSIILRLVIVVKTQGSRGKI